VRQDEEDSEQEGSCKGGCLLEQLQQGGKGESRQGMPQVKELKSLMLLVSNQEKKRQIQRGDCSLYLSIFIVQ